MSLHHKPSLVDRFFPVILIAIGVIFIGTLALFHPFH
jgi:hypothetical protein